MIERWAFSVATATAIMALGSPSSAQGLISKKYVLDEEKSDAFHNIVANGVPSTSNVNWPDFRRRIYKSSGPGGSLRITEVGIRIAISDDSPRPIIDVIAGGDSMKWKINDGQLLDVFATANGGEVKLTVRSYDYQRTTVFRNVGQQLIAESTIIGSGLSAPISYRLVYN